MTSKKGKKDGRPSRRESSRGGALGYSVERAGELLGISRSSAYAGARNGDIPAERIGHLLIVPRDRFHAKFGALPQGGTVAA